MLYKIKHNIVDMDLSQYTKPSDTRTRGLHRFFIEQTDHLVLFNSFFPRTIRDWNSLPASTDLASSLETFKARIGCCDVQLAQPCGFQPC